MLVIERGGCDMKGSIKSRIATLLVGYTFDQVMTKSYTYGVVPMLMIRYGIWEGTLLNLAISFFLCLTTIRLYDWAKKDWLGIEMLKGIREGQGGGLFQSLLSWALRRGDWAMMLVLSIFKDAFVCTVWMRKGAYEYKGMDRRDWSIFTVTLFLSTLWESAWVSFAVLTARKIWASI